MSEIEGKTIKTVEKLNSSIYLTMQDGSRFKITTNYSRSLEVEEK